MRNRKSTKMIQIDSDEEDADMVELDGDGENEPNHSLVKQFQDAVSDLTESLCTTLGVHVEDETKKEEGGDRDGDGDSKKKQSLAAASSAPKSSAPKQGRRAKAKPKKNAAAKQPSVSSSSLGFAKGTGFGSGMVFGGTGGSRRWDANATRIETDKRDESTANAAFRAISLLDACKSSISASLDLSQVEKEGKDLSNLPGPFDPDVRALGLNKEAQILEGLVKVLRDEKMQKCLTAALSTSFAEVCERLPLFFGIVGFALRSVVFLNGFVVLGWSEKLRAACAESGRAAQVFLQGSKELMQLELPGSAEDDDEGGGEEEEEEGNRTGDQKNREDCWGPPQLQDSLCLPPPCRDSGR
mmetsp:Transcript_14258/g.28638  ORF Transcript_14258/g.28638 Transcript_14258/m.28638 type:complete len:356 (+) Transcript_14258:285-1352(+)